MTILWVLWHSFLTIDNIRTDVTQFWNRILGPSNRTAPIQFPRSLYMLPMDPCNITNIMKSAIGRNILTVALHPSTNTQTHTHTQTYEHTHTHLFI